MLPRLHLNCADLSEPRMQLAPQSAAFSGAATKRVVPHLVLLWGRLAIWLLRVAALAIGPLLLLLPVLLRRVALVVPLWRPARVACTQVGDSG